MLELAGEFDGFLCGDDAITQSVIDGSLPRLKVISKYGIGLDKINVNYATEKKIPILFTPGVNHTTVAEHCFGLLLGITKKIHSNAIEVSSGSWKSGWKKIGNSINRLKIQKSLNMGYARHAGACPRFVSHVSYDQTLTEIAARQLVTRPCVGH